MVGTLEGVGQHFAGSPAPRGRRGRAHPRTFAQCATRSPSWPRAALQADLDSDPLDGAPAGAGRVVALTRHGGRECATCCATSSLPGPSRRSALAGGWSRRLRAHAPLLHDHPPQRAGHPRTSSSPRSRHSRTKLRAPGRRGSSAPTTSRRSSRSCAPTLHFTNQQRGGVRVRPRPRANRQVEVGCKSTVRVEGTITSTKAFLLPRPPRTAARSSSTSTTRQSQWGGWSSRRSRTTRASPATSSSRCSRSWPSARVPQARVHRRYGEGWGLYSERLADEMGIYSTPARPDRNARRPTRCAPAGSSSTPGLHALGWSRQQAIDYMTRELADAGSQIVPEIDRYRRRPARPGLHDRPARDPADAARDPRRSWTVRFVGSHRAGLRLAAARGARPGGEGPAARGSRSPLPPVVPDDIVVGTTTSPRDRRGLYVEEDRTRPVGPVRVTTPVRTQTPGSGAGRRASPRSRPGRPTPGGSFSTRRSSWLRRSRARGPPVNVALKAHGARGARPCARRPAACEG